MIKLHFYKLVLSPFSAFNLNVFRFLYCTGFLLTMLYHRSFYFGDIPACIYNPLGVVRWINVGSPSEALFQNLFIISVIFLFLAALGVFARTSLLISSLSTLLFFAFFLSCGRPDQPTYLNPQHKIAIGTLFILALSPKVDLFRLSNLKKWLTPKLQDIEIPCWPATFILTNIGFTYFSAGLCKVYLGWDWFGPGALSHVLTSRTLLLELPFTEYLLKFPYIIQFFSVATMVLELGFILCLFFPRTLYFFIPFSLLFQVMISWLMDIEFFYYFGLNYLILVNFKKIWFYFFDFKRKELSYSPAQVDQVS